MTSPNEKISLKIDEINPFLRSNVEWTVYIKGDVIQNAKVHMGYNHRGIEKALEGRTWSQNKHLISRICGVCSTSHQNAFVLVAEKCANILDEVSLRVKFIRSIISELERIQNHMLWYGLIGHDIGNEIFFHSVWRDREIAMDILEIITGNRVTHNMLTFGGVNRDIPPKMAIKITKKLQILRKKIKHHYYLFNSDNNFKKRLQEIGILSYKDAINLGAVGPTARASGVDFDLRRDEPYDGYVHVPRDIFQVIKHIDGDIYALVLVRLGESLISIDIVSWLLENLPNGELKQVWQEKIPPNEASQAVEAPRGENLHYGRSNGSEKPERYKIRAPTMANLTATIQRLKGNIIEDLPLIVRGMDPCQGCCERFIIINRERNKKQIMKKEDFFKKK